MYVVAERWKVRDINGQLRTSGEIIELSREDAARLLKTGVIRELAEESHNADDDDYPGDDGGDGEAVEDSGGGDGGDEEINDANGVSTDGGDIPLPQAGTPGDGDGRKPKPKARRGA